MTHVVYGFRNVGSMEARYVGQTKHTAQHRLQFETSCCNPNGTHAPLFARWLLGEDGEVEGFTIRECADEWDARYWERETIKTLLALGHRLFNRQHVPAARRIEALPSWTPRPSEQSSAAA